MSLTEDPYEILAEYYGISEQQTMECVDEVLELFGDQEEVTPRQLAEITLDAVISMSSKSIFVLLKSKLSGELEAVCTDTLVKISEPFVFEYSVDNVGITNVDIYFSTSKGAVGFRVYKGIIDDLDPFQSEARMMIDLTHENKEYFIATNGDIMVWEEIPVVYRSAFKEIHGLRDVLDGKSADVLVAEIISFGRYVRNKCKA